MVNVRKNRNPFFMAMIVIVLIAVLIAAAIGVFTNKSMIDMTYSFERAMIRLPDGDIVEGHVSSWTDFEDGDQIQVRIGSKTYLTHISNVVLISE